MSDANTERRDYARDKLTSYSQCTQSTTNPKRLPQLHPCAKDWDPIDADVSICPTGIRRIKDEALSKRLRTKFRNAHRTTLPIALAVTAAIVAVGHLRNRLSD